jgi:hypothetical protein
MGGGLEITSDNVISLPVRTRSSEDRTSCPSCFPWYLLLDAPLLRGYCSKQARSYRTGELGTLEPADDSWTSVPWRREMLGNAGAYVLQIWNAKLSLIPGGGDSSPCSSPPPTAVLMTAWSSLIISSSLALRSRGTVRPIPYVLPCSSGNQGRFQ